MSITEKDKIRSGIVITLIILIGLILITLIVILAIYLDNDRDEFCNKEGGYHESFSRVCYKKDSNGELVKYEIRYFNGEPKLVRGS